jgi:hypothetical protein
MAAGPRGYKQCAPRMQDEPAVDMDGRFRVMVSPGGHPWALFVLVHELGETAIIPTLGELMTGGSA